MSSSALKIIAAIAVVVTLLLALIGYRVSRQYAENSAQAAKQVQRQAQAPRTLAVVAVKPLAAYKAIARDDVSLVEIAVAPKAYYSSVDDVVGKQPLLDIDVGAPVTQRYFREGNLLARVIPAGYQAVSVEVTDVIGVGGFVRPGDIVDVLMYLKEGNDIEKSQARVLLADVRVLAYEERIVDRPDGLKPDEKSTQTKSRGNRTAVLAVPQAETTRLMLGSSLGELRLALHGQQPAADAPEAVVAGGLPANPQALAAIREAKVPDQAITAGQLGQLKPPPAASRQIHSVTVYRGAVVDRVVVKP